MLTIRLQRTGRVHQPYYRIVVAEKTRHVSKKFKAILGNYNPRTKELIISDKTELDRCIGNNIEMSDTVKSILKKNKHLS